MKTFIKNLWKKYSSWHLPNKIGTWSFLLTVLTTPLAIMGYFEFFGNDHIAEKLNKSLQVHARPHLNIKSLSIPTQHDHKKIISVKIENYSRFNATKIRTSIQITTNSIIKSKFNSSVHSRDTRAIFALSSIDLAIMPWAQLEEALSTLEPTYKLVDLYLKKHQLNHKKTVEKSTSFLIIIEYVSEVGEPFTMYEAVEAIFQKI